MNLLKGRLPLVWHQGSGLWFCVHLEFPAESAVMLLSHQMHTTMIGVRMHNSTHACTSVTCVRRSCMLSPRGLMFFLECHSLCSRNHVGVFWSHARLTWTAGKKYWDAGSLCLKWLDIKPNIRPISLAGFRKNMLSQLPLLPHSLLCTHTHTLTHTEPQKTLLPFAAVGRKQDCS